MNPRAQTPPRRGSPASRYGGNYAPGYTVVPRLRKGAAPRLANLRQPENGFAIGNQRFAGIPQNDPYAQHSNAMDQEKLWQVLTTEAGRQAIGA